MVLARGYISSTIIEAAGVWTLRIQFSYYGISTYEEVSVHTTLIEAKNHLLLVRCPNLQVIDSKSVLQVLK